MGPGSAYEAGYSDGADSVLTEALRLGAENVDLRDRLRIMTPMVCEGCGCEARCGDRALCWDCNTARLSCVLDGWSQDSSHAAACVSVGLRALCGRRILEGC